MTFPCYRPDAECVFTEHATNVVLRSDPASGGYVVFSSTERTIQRQDSRQDSPEFCHTALSRVLKKRKFPLPRSRAERVH